ncbi:MAG: HlyD family secretion protein [Pseudomonadota bacterium]
MARLFRKEALEHRGQRLWGEVIVIQPLSSSVMVGLFLALIIGLFATLIFGSYARTETAPGFLAPDSGLVRVYAPQSGVVSAISAREGDQVDAGMALMSIVIEQSTLSGESAEARALPLIDQQLATLGDRLALERTRAAVDERRLTSELASLGEELTALAAQRRMQEEITASAAKSFADLGELVDKGYVAKTEFESRRQALLAQRQQGRQLDQRLLALKRQQEETRLALERLPTDLSDRLAQIESESAALKQRRAEIEGRQAYTITAPVSGRVAALQTSIGDVAHPQMPLLVILPEGGALEAELYVPSRAIGFVRQGQEVRLLYDAFPYQRFGAYRGVVKTVTKTILAPAEAATPFTLQEPAYRVKVALSDQAVDAFGEAVPLQPGMTLQARIVLERQSLLAWLAEPWRAVRSRS